MKRWLVLLVCLGSFFSVVVAQDSLVMKYKYKFKYERSVTSSSLPLQQYAQVAAVKNGLEEKEDTTTPHLLELHKTWRSKKNKVLWAKDFILEGIAERATNTELDKFYLARRTCSLRRQVRYKIILYEKELGGGSAAKEYWKNPEEFPNPYPECIDKYSFKYTIPVLHEVDWISLPPKTEVDTIEQKRLFFTDSTLVTIRDKQWQLLDVSYCVGYKFPDTINNTTFQWKYTEVELPKIRFSKSKYKIFSSKKKRIKIGRLSYTFSSPQRLFGTEEYVIKCTVKDRKKTYIQNLFLGKGSQLVFHDIVLNVLDVDSYGLLVKYQKTRGDN